MPAPQAQEHTWKAQAKPKPYASKPGPICHQCITRLETTDSTEAALNELAKFKAIAENDRVEAGNLDGPIKEVETELMNGVAELKAQRLIFGPLLSFEDLVNPPGEQEIGENPDWFESDANIVEMVRKGVSGVAAVEDDSKIEECQPPQMGQLEMAKLCKTLGSVCIGAGVEAGYELSKVLRKFESQIWALDVQRSTQQRLNGWLNVGTSLL
ncbi:hypothetical protein EDB84DRAFT_1560467 [Lactarius hengduanensis]|nr:hypothetical protein EDB84DRAFT_1560467 [Lactarius hengduanensis]